MDSQGMTRVITLEKASDITPQKVQWLIPHWIPRAELTLIAGVAGLGKSTFAMDICAQATQGAYTAEPLNVLYILTEDDKARTAVPRATVAGANLERIFFPQVEITYYDHTGVSEAGVSTLRLPQDIAALEHTITEQNIGLIVFDALKSTMETSNGNNDLEVRKFLTPLSALAQRTNCTMLGIIHHNKGSSSDGNARVSGSSAFVEVVRSVLSITLDKDSDSLVIWNSKGNLASEELTHEGKIVTEEFTTKDGDILSVGRFQLGEKREHNGEYLLAPHDNTEDSEERSEVEEYLLYLLANGAEMKSKEVITQTLKDVSTSKSTIKRAFKKLGGHFRREGTPPTSYWSIPSTQKVEDNPYSYAALSEKLTTQTAHTGEPIENHTPTSINNAENRVKNPISSNSSPKGPLALSSNREPIEPIGTDQRKRDEPIEQSNTGSEPIDTEQLLLTILTDTPMGIVSLMKHFKEAGGSIPAINSALENLMARNLITQHKDSTYTLTGEK